MGGLVVNLSNASLHRLDVGDLTAGMEQLLTDPDLRADLIRRGRERAAQFTWPAAARQLLTVYTRLLEGQ